MELLVRDAQSQHSSTVVTAGCAEALKRTRQIGKLAVSALKAELLMFPKPGLVSPRDTGAHSDMSAATMMDAIDALGPFFMLLAAQGAAGASFDGVLRKTGIVAEGTMLDATRGVNTHRGAIFSLGMLVAALARTASLEHPLTPESVSATLTSTWGRELNEHALRLGSLCEKSARNGERARRRYGTGGAPKEAARGFPTVFQLALPVLRRARRRGLSDEASGVQTFFSLLARVTDTNVLHRRGRSGHELVRRSTLNFLSSEGCYRKGWRQHAEWVHEQFCHANVSPGGCADLLAATLILDAGTATTRKRREVSRNSLEV